MLWTQLFSPWRNVSHLNRTNPAVWTYVRLLISLFIGRLKHRSLCFFRVLELSTADIHEAMLASVEIEECLLAG